MNKLFTYVSLFVLGIGTTLAQTGQPSAHGPVTLPMLFPAPQSIDLDKGAWVLGRSAILIVAPGTEAGTVDQVRAALTFAGIKNITTAQKLPSVIDGTYVVIGTGKSAAVNDALKISGTTIDNHTEGYTITTVTKSNGGIITLAGHDADGLFHAVQTLKQLVKRPYIPALVIQDHPSMPIRGTIEGFYGAPWTMENRTKHLDFLAGVKANTYVYSPKDDPYARDRWRDDYPANTLAELGKLVATAQRNHINFVYAISPGPTVCFSDPAELKLIEHKFEALRSIGVHNFYVALDDIEYTKWNCDKDKAAFGAPSAEAAGIAQAKFLNAVQASLNANDLKAQPLIMVPTEYYDAKESPYKASLRKHLDPKIVVQWTGTDVVPPAIATTDAKAATKAFGRKTLLWDNYPVNDYAQTTGRLLLAPYTRREAGLADELSGILSNPMNQEAASRPAVTGVAAFAWNDKAYDANRTWHFSARELAGGDERTTAALLTFFDTQHIAPTFGNQPWQEQAPRLKATLDAVREAIAGDNAATRKQAIAGLVKCADDLAAASDIIHSGAIDPAFAQEARPWLDALQLWGRALQLTAAGLDAAGNNSTAATRYFASAKKMAAEAAAVQSIKGATRFDGPIKIADGVLDVFVADAPKMIAFE